MKIDLNKIRAGDFIDLDEWFSKMQDDERLIIDFLNLLCGDKIPTTEEGIIELINEYARQVVDIKETYTWLFNPPPIPSSVEKEINNRYLLEDFANDYTGYIEIIYLLCNGDMTKVEQVKEMPTQDFFFWGEYLFRKRYIENVK